MVAVTAVGLLGPADTAVIAGDADTAVGLTAAAAVAAVTVEGGGATDTLRPLGRTAPLPVPLTSTHVARIDLWDGATADKLGTLDEDESALAVVIGDTGWVLPGAAHDVGLDADHRWDAAAVATAAVVWQPTGVGRIIEHAFALDSNTSQTVAVSAGETVWLALTTAGSVGGSSRTVGVYETTISSGSVAVSGARGWLLVTAEDQP